MEQEDIKPGAIAVWVPVWTDPTRIVTVIRSSNLLAAVSVQKGYGNRSRIGSVGAKSLYTLEDMACEECGELPTVGNPTCGIPGAPADPENGPSSREIPYRLCYRCVTGLEGDEADPDDFSWVYSQFAPVRVLRHGEEHHPSRCCDLCGASISAERMAKYARNRNHDDDDPFYCSVGCYDQATGQVR